MPSTPEVIGRYKIERFLASGGMGDIYLARDPMLDRLVAIKLLREGFDSDGLRERFEREARAAGRLSHPNIVTIHEFGLFEERPFIAMEYVPGSSLAAIIRQREPMAITRKLEIIEGLCAGLAHAHRANIVHRDVKPANLIVDPEGGVKVLDFGIVKLAGSSASGLTHHGMLVGTVNYMSPEQIAGSSESVDHRSDVFAVGAVFYELLAYQLAFPGQVAEVIYKIVYGTPEPLSKFCPGLDPEIERAVLKCLERAPEQRYQELTTLRRDLTRIRLRLEDEQAVAAAGATVDTVSIPAPANAPLGPASTPLPDRISGLLVSAQVALDGRDVDRALLICEQAAKIAPADTRVRDLQRSAQALRDAQRVEALIAEAVAHLAADRLMEARVAIDLATVTQPDSAKALEVRQRIDQATLEEDRRRERARRLGSAMVRARAELERQALAKARAAVDEALKVDPNHPSAVTLRAEIDAALAAAQERVRREEAAREEAARVQRREACLTAARAALASDDVTAALAAVDEAVTHGGGEGTAAVRAEILARQRFLERAARRLHDAQARFAAGDLAAATTLVDEVLGIVPQQPDALLLRANIARAVEERRARDAWLRSTVDGARDALRKDRFDEALAALERVRQAEPSWPGVDDLIREVTTRQAAERERRRREEEVARRLAHATELLGRGDLDAARAQVERARTLDPASAGAKEIGARIAKAHDARLAEEARRRAAEERARRLEQFARGREALAAGRIDEALDLLRPLATGPQEPGFAEALRHAEAEHARLEEEWRRQRERAERIAAALGRAQQRLDEHAFDAATVAVGEALAIDEAHAEALALRARIAAALEARVDEVIGIAAAHGAKGQPQRGVKAIDAAALRHPRLAAERERLVLAAEAQALDERVEAALVSARGRFRRRPPEDILASLEQSGLRHPRIDEEMAIARQAIAEAAARSAAALEERLAREQAARDQQAREQQARQEREEQARAEKARAEQARAEQARVEQARAEQARAEQARAEQARAEQARIEQARAEQARAEQARAEQARAEQAKAERVQAERAQLEQARAKKPGPRPPKADQTTAITLRPVSARSTPIAPTAAGPLVTIPRARASTMGGDWQRLAALVGGAIVILVLGFIAARRLWSPPPDSSTAQGGTPASSTSAPATPDKGASARPGAATTPGTTPGPGPVTPADPIASPPAATASPAERAQAVATRIRQWLARSQRDRALEEAAAASAQLGAEPALREALGRLSEGAQRDAQRSRDTARAAGAEARDAIGFAAAQSAFQGADRARRRGQLVDAARSYWNADALFVQSFERSEAGRLAQQAATPPVQPQTRPETPRETETTPPRQTPATTPTTAPPPVQQQQQPPPVTREPERAPQAPAFDPAAVRSTLAAYTAGYANRSVEAIARVYPNLPARDRLEAAFRNASSYELSLGACEVTQQSPTVAVSRCSGGRRSIRFRSGQPLNQDVTLTFTLERRNGDWVITAVQ